MKTNPVDAVLERLGKDGKLWRKGDLGYYESDTTPVCMVGGIKWWQSQEKYIMHWEHVVNDGVEIANILAGVIEEQFPERVTYKKAPYPVPAVTSFNDHPATSFADVRLVLEKGRLIWEERNG